MPEYLMAIVRCDCGGGLQREVVRTKRGPRWRHVCEWCGSRWQLQDGVLGPVGHDPSQQLAERDLLAWFRRLPGELQAEVVAHVQALALSDGGTQQTR